MANIKSAKKRIKVINRKNAENRRIKNSLKAIIKNFYKALAAKDFDAAKEKLVLAEKKLMQAAAKNTIHKNQDEPCLQQGKSRVNLTRPHMCIS